MTKYMLEKTFENKKRRVNCCGLPHSLRMEPFWKLNLIPLWNSYTKTANGMQSQHWRKHWQGIFHYTSVGRAMNIHPQIHCFDYNRCDGGECWCPKFSCSTKHMWYYGESVWGLCPQLKQITIAGCHNSGSTCGYSINIGPDSVGTFFGMMLPNQWWCEDASMVVSPKVCNMPHTGAGPGPKSYDDTRKGEVGVNKSQWSDICLGSTNAR